MDLNQSASCVRIPLIWRAGRKRGAAGAVIGFWDYFRVGAPLTIITLAFTSGTIAKPGGTFEP
jgi:hypothetical protein